MHINNSTLLSTYTYKNLANRSVKSADGGKAVGLNMALSLHSHSRIAPDSMQGIFILSMAVIVESILHHMMTEE